MRTKLIDKKPQNRDSRRCSCGKVRFRDKTEAVAALHDIHNIAKASLEECGTTRRHECRSYRCAQCRGWHLTSQPMAQNLSQRRLAA